MDVYFANNKLSTPKYYNSEFGSALPCFEILSQKLGAMDAGNLNHSVKKQRKNSQWRYCITPLKII